MGGFSKCVFPEPKTSFPKGNNTKTRTGEAGISVRSKGRTLPIAAISGPSLPALWLNIAEFENQNHYDYDGLTRITKIARDLNIALTLPGYQHASRKQDLRLSTSFKPIRNSKVTSLAAGVLEIVEVMAFWLSYRQSACLAQGNMDVYVSHSHNSSVVWIGVRATDPRDRFRPHRRY